MQNRVPRAYQLKHLRLSDQRLQLAMRSLLMAIELLPERFMGFAPVHGGPCWDGPRRVQLRSGLPLAGKSSATDARKGGTVARLHRGPPYSFNDAELRHGQELAQHP